ncbi:CTSF [Bugula neritina]|uniref:CTSF n=1 Tax=Bugula neritina TaxID=10212 RepID=A0A7J7J5J8_BUGNE|nr:CTSF [Bugula neritina]KAF6034179.1 CTSF [Bugula neritina]
MKLIVILAFCLATAVYGKGLGDTLKVFQGIGPVIAGGQEAQAKVEEEAKQQLLGEDDYENYAGLWAEFKYTHSKSYSSLEEEVERYEIFQANMVRAKVLQTEEQGTATYGPSVYADMSEEEFRVHLMDPKFFAKGHNLRYDAIPSDPAPESFDWREKGAVTEVKNQGQCGSCWAFSTTGNIEGQWFIKKNQLVSLSEQELVSCDKVDQGCEGGLPSDAYKQIIKLGGLEAEKDYPYDGVDERCQMKTNPVVYINDSVAISKDEGEMASWLAQNGPISIGINAAVMQVGVT